MSEKTYAVPEFPWHILVASNLNPEKQPSGPHEIDKNRFIELMQELSPSLSFSVENTMAAEPKHLDVDITFKTMKDFTPDAVAAKVPFLTSLLELKDTLKKYRSGQIDKNSLLPFLSNNQIPAQIKSILESVTGRSASVQNTSQQQQAPAKTGEKAEDKTSSLDNILSMTDPSADDEKTNAPPPPLNKPIDGLIQSVTEGVTTDISIKDVDTITHTIDTILAGQVSAVIHHPVFITLETAWRELKFLVDHTNFREGVKIDVIACAKDTLCETLAEKVFRPAWNTGTMAPDLIVSSHALNSTAVDYEIAENIAKFGQSTQTPVIVWAGPGFFNIDSYTKLNASVPSISELLKGTGYEKWRSLREKSESDWFVMAANGFCLRNTYGKDKGKVKTFAYEEPSDPESLPCGSAPIAIASILSETFARLGTEQILEMSGKPHLETLAIFTVMDNRNNPVSSTCITVMDSDQVWDLTDSGLIPINCLKNDTKIIMASTNSFSSDETSLASMILAGHVSRILISIARNNSDVSVEDTQDTARAVMKKILFNNIAGQYPEDYLEVTVAENTEEKGVRSFAINAEMPYKILGEEVSFNAAFTI